MCVCACVPGEHTFANEFSPSSHLKFGEVKGLVCGHGNSTRTQMTWLSVYMDKLQLNCLVKALKQSTGFRCRQPLQEEGDSWRAREGMKMVPVRSQFRRDLWGVPTSKHQHPRSSSWRTQDPPFLGSRSGSWKGRSDSITASKQGQLRESLQLSERSSSKWGWEEKFRLREPDQKKKNLG